MAGCHDIEADHCSPAYYPRKPPIFLPQIIDDLSRRKLGRPIKPELVFIYK